MNAGELIKALGRLDPKTPIRYAFQEEFRDWPTEVEIDSVSVHGWLNDDENDEDFDESAVLYIERSPSPENWSAFERNIRENLSKVYPKFEAVGFDGSLYWKSLDRYTSGDIIEHEGRRYRVKYGWHWYSRGPVPIYMAELELVED